MYLGVVPPAILLITVPSLISIHTFVGMKTKLLKENVPGPIHTIPPPALDAALHAAWQAPDESDPPAVIPYVAIASNIPVYIPPGPPEPVICDAIILPELLSFTYPFGWLTPEVMVEI